MKRVVVVTATSSGLGRAFVSSAAWGMPSSMLVSKTYKSSRHTTHYIECGPSAGPLLMFLHGWPEISLVWRAQMEAFAAKGWHCVAPGCRVDRQRSA